MPAHVVYRFVIDTTGTIVPCSVTTVSATDPEFVTFGRDALLRTWFRPARKAGRPVPIVAQLGVKWNVH